jgi:hypothetical protein
VVSPGSRKHKKDPVKKVIGFVVILFVIMGLIINSFTDIEQQDQDQSGYQDGRECDEYSMADSTTMDATHHRSWEDYLTNSFYCRTYTAGFATAEDSRVLRNSFSIEQYFDDNDYWKQVYYQLYLNDYERLQPLQDSLTHVREELQLDRESFARMIVSMVQDIPYEYVLPEQCDGTEVHPCNGNVAYGIFSPAEFVYAMKGDCDTRTVLLFTLLKNFGYEPLIINSNEYLHSMLALDVPSSGDDFEYKGKRYAYWETTNVGWLPGMLPPDMNNKNYWTVAIDYEFENSFTGGH